MAEVAVIFFTQSMFNNYPKTRSILSDAYQKIYAEHYKNNRDGATRASSVSQKMEEWLHKKVAQDLQDGKDKSTLEIGAGTLNQLLYEETQPYDIIEPFTQLFEKSPLLPKIRHIYQDIDDINLDTQYDRITAIATFEHVLDLPKVVAKSAILLKENGTLRVSIPNEGTILWKLGYTLTTGIEFRLKYGLPYETLMRHEHVNSAKDVKEIVSYFFGNVKDHSFGLNRHLAFYRFFECAEPQIDKAKAYLKL